MKVPVKPEDKSKTYFKYYEMDMTQLTPEQNMAVKNGKGDPSNALILENRNDLFKTGNLPGEEGFFVMPDGSGHVAHRTLMPGITGQMLEWWFAWHPLDDLRYIIWDPEDHFGTQLPDESHRRKILNPDVPLREKSWGVTHVVKESIGGPPTNIEIRFMDPSDLGYDKSKIGTAYCDFLVCANAFIQPDENTKVPAVMTHVARTVDGVLEFRSRFWIGWNVIDGRPVKLLPEGMTVPEMVLMGLYGHCIKEYQHLAKILPSLYAEEKDNW